MPSTQPSPAFELSLVQLSGRMRRALDLFSKITGLSAVTSVATSFSGSGEPSALSPPVHPRCARQLHSVRTMPCREQWLIHVRSSRRSSTAHSHTCPIGLRCSCVPIRFDGHLVGVAKVVVGSETSDRAFSAATSVLNLIVSGICQDSLVSVLSKEVGALRKSVAEFQQIQSADGPIVCGSDPAITSPDSQATQARNQTLVDSALALLHRHYQMPDLSLSVVAEALACNPRYLTTRFTLIVGEHMHAYLIKLRVAHACRLLIDTSMPIKEAAYAAGFSGNAGLARAFRRQVGVSPGDYRRIFAAH